MTDLVTFLRSCFDEDERVAREAQRMLDEQYGAYEQGKHWADKPTATSVYDEVDACVAMSPDRVLADIESKRKIVERNAALADIQVRRQTRNLAGDTLLALAQPYAGRAGFDPAWRV